MNSFDSDRWFDEGREIEATCSACGGDCENDCHELDDIGAREAMAHAPTPVAIVEWRNRARDLALDEIYGSDPLLAPTPPPVTFSDDFSAEEPTKAYGADFAISERR